MLIKLRNKITVFVPGSRVSTRNEIVRTSDTIKPSTQDTGFLNCDLFQLRDRINQPASRFRNTRDK